MNASAQATNVEIVSKIAAIVNLFKFRFPDVMADLSPWVADEQTAKFEDTNSVDIAFHFPGYSRSYYCRTILLQIKFYCEIPNQTYRAIGIEASGYGYQGQRWYVSKKEGEWQFEGVHPPAPEKCTLLISVCAQILDLFNQLPHQSNFDHEDI